MAPRLGSAAHVCGELFACIPSLRQSECAEYIRVRQRSHFLPEGITPAVRPPFVIEDFIQVLVTAFMPKDLAARAQKMVHAIQQGPAQALSLFLGDYNKWCTRAGHLAPTGAARIEIHKGGLNDFVRTAAATRGFKSDVNWDEYSDGLRQLATELEQLPAFVNAKGSKVSMYVDRRGAPLAIAYDALQPIPATPAPAARMDPDGDTVMGGVNAISTGTDFAAQIAAMEARLASQIANAQANPPGQRNTGRGSSAGDPRPYPPAVSVDVRQQRLANRHCERCDADPSHRWSDCRYCNFQLAPTVPGARRANVNAIAAANSGNA